MVAFNQLPPEQEQIDYMIGKIEETLLAFEHDPHYSNISVGMIMTALTVILGCKLEDMSQNNPDLEKLSPIVEIQIKLLKKLYKFLFLMSFPSNPKT